MTPSLPKPLPRFLPTLTEVIQPQEAGEMLAMAGAAPVTPALVPTAPSVASADTDLLVQRVTARVDALLESRLRQVIHGLVQEQAHLLGPRLRQELAPLVQQAVAEAITEESRRTF